MRLVDYLIATDGPPAPSGLAYDYVLARDGVYVQAENEYLAARVPIAHCEVRGLRSLQPMCRLKHGRIAFGIWQHIVAVAQVWALHRQEVLLTVRHDHRLGYHLVVPRQATGETEIAYSPAPNVVLEIHSHHAYRARFSWVDDADEERLALYGVVGRLDTERPEVALRVGVYGYFMTVAWRDVFDEELEAFRDLADEPDEEGNDDGVPN